jgi:chromosome segregation ATPase
MNLHQPFTRWGSLALLSLTAVVTLLAFNGAPAKQPAIANHTQDTLPQKRNKITREETGDRDLDKELRQLDKAQEQMDKLKDKDWDEIQRKIEESIRKIDVEKIQQQVDDAVRKIDYEKINRQVQQALRKIDFDKIQRDIDQSLDDAKKIDRDEIRRELEKAKKQVKEALEKEDWKEEMKEAQQYNREEVKKELENAKKEMARAREEIKNQKFNFKKEMEKASVDIDKAKVELKGYQEMIYEMEKDGLLSTSADYTIEYKNSDLFINDKKQPQEVADKYKKYFSNKTIAIKKHDGKISINHQESSDTHSD